MTIREIVCYGCSCMYYRHKVYTQGTVCFVNQEKLEVMRQTWLFFCPPIAVYAAIDRLNNSMTFYYLLFATKVT